MTDAMLQVVSRNGRLEIELVEGSAEEREELVDLLQSAKLLLHVDDAGRAFVRSVPESDGESDYWFQAARKGGAFDFLDNEIDNAIWD
jgi:hypothetical protein